MQTKQYNRGAEVSKLYRDARIFLIFMQYICHDIHDWTRNISGRKIVHTSYRYNNYKNQSLSILVYFCNYYYHYTNQINFQTKLR